jgi:hypothetical protein
MKVNKRYVRPNERRLRFESLEGRQMLAVSLELSTNVAIQPLLDTDGLPKNVNVSGPMGQPTAYQSEMTLDVNPTNPLHLAGFSHKLIFDPSDPETVTDYSQIDVFQSVDGGKSWTTTTINDQDEGIGIGLAELRGDPSIAFDAVGNLYIAYGHRSASGTDHLIVARQNAGQATFTQFRSATTVSGTGSLDKWHLATGSDGSGSNNQAVYVAYTQTTGNDYNIMVAGSSDGGNTFTTTAVGINDAAMDGHKRLFADPAVGPGGELHVAWIDLTAKTIHFDSDLNGLSGGFSFGTDVLVKQVTYSLDFPTIVNAQPDLGLRAGLSLDVDRSGRPSTNGRLYLTWVDGVGANFPSTTNQNSDIFLSYSTNGGVTWSPTGSVGNVDDSSGTEFNPWVDVDQITGSVNVLYYTTDGDQADGNNDVSVRIATSINGGDSFVYTTLSRQTSRENDGNPNDYLEYNGLAVHGGTLHGLWASRVAGGGAQGKDLEALYGSASLLSEVGDNVLTISGDDGGMATDDTIVVARSAANSDYLEVMVNGNLQYAGLLATVNVIIIDAGDGYNIIQIDANLDADVRIDGGSGIDELTLFGRGESLLGDFEFYGDAGNDIFTINFQNGDPLPRAGFNFNFDDGPGQDDVLADDSEGTHIAYFVAPTFLDAVDISIGDGRADSSSTEDDQTTLRAAIQEANFAAAKRYIFLPNGTYSLSLTGNRSHPGEDFP